MKKLVIKGDSRLLTNFDLIREFYQYLPLLTQKLSQQPVVGDKKQVNLRVEGVILKQVKIKLIYNLKTEVLTINLTI